MGAIELVAPDLLGNIPWIVFGRIRQIHTNVVMFGFVGTGLLGVAHYLVPTLLRTPLYSERLGKLTLWLWNLAIAVGVVTLSMGHTQNREYAEFIWPVDIGVLMVLALIFYNLFQTLRRRTETLLYVSVWYVFGALIFTFFTYFFGNAIWNPGTGSISGMPDAILAWFYGHNILGFFFTPLAVAAAYYIIPIVCRAPLYSHTLSLIGFWSILAFVLPHRNTSSHSSACSNLAQSHCDHGQCGDDRSRHDCLGQSLVDDEGSPWLPLLGHRR